MRGNSTLDFGDDARFQRAATLLRLLHHGLQTATRNRLLRDELSCTRQRVQHLEAENAQFRKELHRRIPEVATARSCPGPGNHTEQVVQAMLDYLRRHYQRPITLGEVARALDMNASYLSSLFSRTVGVHFHHYLEELRRARAEELLRDPRLPVCDVACAVGFASADYFRHAFKAHTGVSPSVWRATRAAI